jgi:hypothetical protein
MPEDPILGDFQDLLGWSGDGAMSDTSSTSSENTSFDFCVTFGGRAVGTAKFAAPSVDEVIALVALLVDKANESEKSNGKPGLWGATLGACPT